MNKQIMIAAGFDAQVKRYEDRRCSWCDVKVYPSSFRDPLSLKEYHISGFCQKCQDQTFGVEE